MTPQLKKRKVLESPSHEILCNNGVPLPILHSSDYFIKPSLQELAAGELSVENYCSGVQNFTVGRLGYGYVTFHGETDVRWLDLDKIVRFNKHEVVVYTDERNKPPTGQGLNKAAEVTLIVQISLPVSDTLKLEKLVKLLRSCTERQGAHFISFNSRSGEWKFSVCHFSRFGLTEEDEDDIVMDDIVVQEPLGPSRVEELEVVDQPQVGPNEMVLSHSLPAHLGLDPVKMQETRMLMFQLEEEDVESFNKDHMITDSMSSKKHFHNCYSSLKTSHRSSSPSAMRKCPQALLEYGSTSDLAPPRNILMTRQSKGLPLRTTKVEGFKLDLKQKTPVTNSHSKNIVDAALFMGRSFRVGWGPNGILLHTGTPVSNTSVESGLSSIIHLEKVAFDKTVRDVNNKVSEEVVDLCFVSPLKLHKSLNHETKDVEVDTFTLKLQRLLCSRLELSKHCREYIGIIERQLDVSGLSTSVRMLLMHQVMIWELIKVLFSTKEISTQSTLLDVDVDDGEDMMDDRKDGLTDLDSEAYPLVRRAEFSYWLQDSVCHRVQEELSSLNESNDLQNIFSFLTGRQLGSAVELAASRGDVRMACLLSQAGGSMVNRSDMAQQLEIWRNKGLDFNFIEKDRLKLYELLAGNIDGALHDLKIDWKRYLGLLMWYRLPPHTSLPVIFHTYEQLLIEGRAPYPLPIYIDEGPLEEAPDWGLGDRFDLAYYLMLLHSDEQKGYGVLKTMFSAFSSTHDPLDYHMIWHQRALLEAIGAFTSSDLQALDMSFVSQLLCLGLCHWAIYVVLHMPHRDDFPYLQANIIREILFQYCESWGTHEVQRKFIEDLGVPSGWLHEALAIYYEYYGDLPKALEHFLGCSNWQKAHSIFMTSVAHSLFSSSNDSEVWSLATSMEEHMSEIADWKLGAGIYIDFYILKSSLQEENNMSELDSSEKKAEACRHFFGRLNESLSVWGSKFPIDARATYSKMAEELCALIMADGGKNSTREVQLSCFDVMLTAPIPEDRRACHLQDAVSVFTYFLWERAS